MRLIDIEPYEKDGWILQKVEEHKDCTVTKRTPLNCIPTEDAVHVVRCKDCRYLHHYDGFELGACQVANFSETHWVSDDFYCLDGERKDDGLI